MSFFPTLRAFFTKHLAEHSSLIPSKSKSERNILLISILKTIQQLVLFGYYTNPNDIAQVHPFYLCIHSDQTNPPLISHQLVSPLYQLLNGKTDKPLENPDDGELRAFHSKERYVNVPANRQIFEIKKEALTIIDLIFNYRVSVVLNSLMLDFKRLLSSSEKRGLQLFVFILFLFLFSLSLSFFFSFSFSFSLFPFSFFFFFPFSLSFFLCLIIDY